MEQRWQDFKNREMAGKRLNEEMKKDLEQWSYNKSRIEEEIVRKQEANRFGSNFEERGVLYERPWTHASARSQIRKEVSEKIVN